MVFLYIERTFWVLTAHIVETTIKMAAMFDFSCAFLKAGIIKVPQKKKKKVQFVWCFNPTTAAKKAEVQLRNDVKVCINMKKHQTVP